MSFSSQQEQSQAKKFKLSRSTAHRKFLKRTLTKKQFATYETRYGKLPNETSKSNTKTN